MVWLLYSAVAYGLIFSIIPLFDYLVKSLVTLFIK